MGVTTSADEALDKADNHIGEAIQQLSKIIIERCWGHDDFNASYREAIQTTFLDLIAMRSTLNRS